LISALAHARTEAAVPLCVVCQPKSNVSNRMFRRSTTSAYITASDLWSTGERSIFPVDGSLIDADYVVMATNLVGARHP